jgi:hypothetical protein
MSGLDLHAKGVAQLTVLALGLTITAVAAASGPQPSVTALAATLAPAELAIGGAFTVTGSAGAGGHGVGGAALSLQSDPYPFDGFSTVAHTVSAPDGSFSFTRIPAERNARLRVLAEGSPGVASKTLRVTVDPTVAIHARSAAPGQASLSLRVRHTVQAGPQSVSAWWFTAPRGTSLFRLAAVTPTRELSPGVSYASVLVNPPAKRFVYRVCLNPPWEHAMGAPASHGRCPRHDFKLPRDAR